jgi:hypothetical protein
VAFRDHIVSFTLSPVPPEKCRDVWDYVRPGLVQVREKCNDRWLPEDIWLALQSKAAFLYMLEEDGDTIGFFVFKNFYDVDGLALYVWVLHAPNAVQTSERAMEVIAQIDALAKGVGAKRIRHHSPRGGWLFKEMFELKMHLYEREV